MSDTSFSVPIVLGPEGRVNTPPATLLANLLALVASQVPGYTANLPGSLIEDISSTDVGALTLSDQYVSEVINSLTPYGANAFILLQLGAIYGVVQGVQTNTSVYVVFSGTPGVSIPQGFVVSDGTYQYTVQDGGIIQTDGQSSPLYCVATVSGTWAVPAGTVNTVVTSVPSTFTVTCTNPQAGTPSAGDQTEAQYRAQVLAAGMAPASAFASQVKAALANVAGVQPRLIAVQQQAPGWKVIVGGGDPYAVGEAIFNAGVDISALVGSLMVISAFTNTSNGQITTVLNHGLSVGNTFTVSQAAPGAFNGVYTVASVVDEKNVTVTTNTSSFGAYTADTGLITPNSRNIVANVIDYPDVYSVTFVNPPQQTVAVQLTWNTSSPYAVSSSAVAQLGAPAIASYINSIQVGQPINLFELQNTFRAAVASLIPTSLLTRMVFTVSINNVSTPAESGTGIIAGDPESYFQCFSNNVTITQG